MKHIEPYAHNMIAMEKAHVDPKTNLQESVIERIKTPRMSFIPSDDDTKHIKNIYVDSKLFCYLNYFNLLPILSYCYCNCDTHCLK